MQSLSTDLSFSADLDELTPNEHADLADHVRQQKSAEFYADGLIFGYQYQSSTVVADPGTYHPSTAPGSRRPHLTLDSQPIYDLLGPQFTAIGPKRKLVGLLEVAEQTGIPLHLVEHGSDVMLVRPDQHIAWSGSKVSDPHQIMRAALNESSPTGSHKTRANKHSITENAELRTLSNAS